MKQMAGTQVPQTEVNGVPGPGIAKNIRMFVSAEVKYKVVA